MTNTLLAQDIIDELNGKRQTYSEVRVPHYFTITAQDLIDSCGQEEELVDHRVLVVAVDAKETPRPVPILNAQQQVDANISLICKAQTEKDKAKQRGRPKGSVSKNKTSSQTSRRVSSSLNVPNL